MNHFLEMYLKLTDVRNQLYIMKGPDGVFKSEASFRECLSRINDAPKYAITAITSDIDIGTYPELTRIEITGRDIPFGKNETRKTIETGLNDMIEKVIFNPPATIVLWKDGTKTVVKTMEGTEFNAYNGFCAAVTKKMLGNNSQIHKVLENAEYQPNEGETKEDVKTSLLREKIKNMCKTSLTNFDGICKSESGECPLFAHTTSSGSVMHNCLSGLDYNHLLEHYKIMFGKNYEEDN